MEVGVRVETGVPLPTLSDLISCFLVIQLTLKLLQHKAIKMLKQLRNS
jgi:hypothetical protein